MKLKLTINYILFTLLRENKRSYFTKDFQNNLDGLKTTGNGINTLISLKESPNIVRWKNVFNKYCVNVASNT